MGFYGNITNTNRTQFVFDKIYPNREEMDKSVTEDGVFVGRYVLIDYNEGLLQDNYYDNYAKDREKYNTDRGYDSTVWQKVFVDEQEKYAMIAELNSIVPTFSVVSDAPTLNPVPPHFDTDSTSVHYKLHVQPSWGFKIKETDSSNSDQYVYNTGSQWNPETKQIETKTDSYFGAIYFNKDGFNSDYRFEKTNNSDRINVTPTGKSGVDYNVSHNSAVIKTEKSPDIQELTINLPSIGNAISTLWDVVYGTGDLDSGYNNRYRRNKNIEWNNVSGLRLVSEDLDGSGFAYNTKKVETLAGCINSVHDLMGMIITQEEPIAGEEAQIFSDRILENALTNRIYYGHYEPNRILNNKPYKGYYIKDLTYKYKEGYKEPEKVELTDFNQGEYYYLNNNNYYLETEGYQNGNKYYTLSDIQEKNLNAREYKAGTFYYKDDDGNFVLDINTWPDENKQYWEVVPGYKSEVDAKKLTFFFPTSQVYFDKYFAETKWTDENDSSKKRGKGLFYTVFDPDKKVQVYKPFKVGINYQSSLYWIENYVIEVSTDIFGNTVEVYDFEKAGTIITEYHMIDFASSEFYAYNENTKDYNRLILEDNIDINKIYYSFKENSVSEIGFDFYQPGIYYYKDNNSYILAMEDRKYDRQYFTIGNIVGTTDVIFYEPNKYYYKDESNNFILDISDIFNPEKEYYIIYHQYVIADTKGIYAVGSKWNSKIDKPDHVTLGTREEKYKWKELIGFSRSLNTIHGLILEVNNFLKFNDKLTRDTKTVQGCINTVNDIINKITELEASKILISDKYGRIASSNVVTDDWIDLNVNNNTITLEHEFNPGENKTLTTNLNDINSNDINLYVPITDKKGHIVASNIETLTLPFGYKTIKDSNETVGQTIANNVKDNLTLHGDDWIKPIVSQGNITYNHIGPVISNENKKDDIQLNFGDSFEIEDWYYDEKGHKSNRTVHSVSIPQNDLIDNTANGSDIITQLSLNKETGVFSSTRANITSLTLADYIQKTDNTNIIANDTLGDALSKLQTQIIEEKDTRSNDVDTIQIALEAEIKTREEAISAEQQARTSAINAEKEVLQESIATEIKNRQDAIQAEAQTRAQAIESEAKIREEADLAEKQARETAINAEQLARENAISTESQARIEADNAEKQARENAIETEQKAREIAINAEQQARTAAINLEQQAREKSLQDEQAARRQAINDVVINYTKEIDIERKTRIDAIENLTTSLTKLQQEDYTLNSRCNVLDKEVKGLINEVTILTNYKSDIDSIKNTIEVLEQKDDTLNSRCDGLDKEVKDLINKNDNFVLKEAYELKIANLEQENYTLNSRCNVLDKEVKDLINRIAKLEEKIFAENIVE